ncbi:hypothetical protein [Serinicoccus sediminis]|uniref:hypothetical protein n=1 Tax=Serinicoccus sediminis TaxID=2306021 RepID=UPI00101F74D9|nr:hypothetical protein [Serinicoccus sediminis]
MVGTTTLRTRGAATTLAGALLLSVLPLAAHAGVDTEPREGQPVVWPAENRTRIKTYQTGGGACSLIASPNSVGGVCVSANASDGPSIREVLKGDDLPDCWHERLTEDELRDTELQAPPEGTFYYWHRCLRGIDRKTFAIEPGGLFFAVGIWIYEPDDPELTELTPNQQAFIARFVRRGNVPDPVMLSSPSAVPWVNDDVAFYNAGEDELHVDLSIPGVEMRGRITELLVYPEGRGGPVVRCPGGGREVDEDDTPQSVPDACWHAYEQASQTQPDDAYQGEIHAQWQIDARIRGEWQPFHSFVKSGEGLMQVNEVQALVRP